MCGYRPIVCAFCEPKGKSIPAYMMDDHVIKEHKDMDLWTEAHWEKNVVDANHLKKLKKTRMIQFRAVAEANGKFTISFGGIRLQISSVDQQLQVKGVKVAR